MSGERSVDVEKINNNEKGFEPAHIRSVISLALFSFVFLGMEFFFDSGLRSLWMPEVFCCIRA